ncbi:MAG: hypothetical protein KGD59_03335 [Candidatus Heimdallarchaeota archaeon]|nr:hypothetical protein [Candidatus Heimdallarchaeota archaeon]MBY8993557.1 hypothetical protein [Candidatus Heimdallarchaeota archaeon]
MQKNYKQICRSLISVIFCILIVSTNSVSSAKLLDDTATNHFMFRIDDIFSYEEANKFYFEGNITGLYSEKNNNLSIETVNYTALRWTIEELTGISIKIMNMTNDDIKFDVEEHYSYSSYEELMINENQSIERYSTETISLSKENITINSLTHRISTSTNTSYYPLNTTAFFWTKANLTIGENLTINANNYHIANYSLVSTFEGVRNVTNLLSDVTLYEEFIFSDYLGKYVYFGEFEKQTMLSFGYSDGLLVSGTTISKAKQKNSFPNAASGVVTISKSIDIVSSSFEEPGREMGSVHWIIGGISFTIVLFLIFESKNLRKFIHSIKNLSKLDRKSTEKYHPIKE